MPAPEKLRVLVCHNRYLHRGGEDSVCESEVQLLRDLGHEVLVYERSNEELKSDSKLSAAFESIWAERTVRDLRQAVGAFSPNVVHVHNTFARISPSVYWAIDRLGLPTVQTLHNFRLFCPQAMFLRDGKVCEDCMGKVPWRGVVRKCFRGSMAQTAALAGMVTTHRVLGTWSRRVTRYIALNKFCRDKFVQGGLPADRIAIKPNFVDFDPPPAGTERRGFLFVGRLSEEKGIATLAHAAQQCPGLEISVVGDGPEAPAIQGVAGVTMRGLLKPTEVRSAMCDAFALVIPSIWYENFPRTLVEAMGCGLPVIASRIGALADLVEDGRTGLLFDPGNPQDLAAKLMWAIANPGRMAELGRNARAEYERSYTGAANYPQLIRIYEDAIRHKATAALR